MIARTGAAALAVLVWSGMAAACSTPAGLESSPSAPFPARPVAISLDRIEPCSLLTTGERQKLGLRAGSPSTPVVDGVAGRGCVWSGSRSLGYTVQTLAFGAETAVSDPAVTLTQIGGFGAVRGPVRDPSTIGGAVACQVIVDASPDGSIRVLAVDGGLPRPGDDQLCRLASEFGQKIVGNAVAASR